MVGGDPITIYILYISFPSIGDFIAGGFFTSWATREAPIGDFKIQD